MTRPPHRSWVEISLGQIARNYCAVRDAVGDSAGVMGVVKADAYGHGAREVARVLEAQGAHWLAVSSVEEGVSLRRAGVRARILVMAGFLHEECEALIEHELTPAVHSLDEIADLESLARARGNPLAYHLKVDTGMSRLGTRAAFEDIAAAVWASPRARLEGLMSHFASAADFNSPQAPEQTAAFREALEALRRAGVSPPLVHLSSTNAVAYARRDAWHNLVRPGHALYGYVSPARGDAPHNLLNVKPALTWKAKVLAVKDLPEGALIGYGGTFRAPRPMRAGILAVGYADGFPHRLSGKGKVIAAGKFAPILGTVSMDLTTIDLSAAPEMQPGDAVTLLGREGAVSLDAMQIARLAGTISYNILCSISPRVRRVYVE